jgi:hypothetical protein
MLVALMAHLLVHELATPIWEAINQQVNVADRPAFLEQTDGVSSSKEANGNQLISIANSIKSSLDLTFLNVEHCGAEASVAMKDIDPSAATFASAKDLFSLHTTYVNLHDELIGNLDCSGQSAAEGTIERRLKCFNSFIGPHGRNKNIGLFYCFLVWEGKSTKWLSKRLHEKVSRSSASMSINQKASTPDDSTSVPLSKKQRQQIEIMKQVLNHRSETIKSTT